ncbi:MAG: YcaO-like family protein [Tissierellia bacterium]|nr:YcaO-like family protein [Tissierellia bacterium]
MLYKKHFKDRDPKGTVEFLKGILADNQLEVEEHWTDESSIHTFSLRVTFKGTDIGTNGKGVSKDLARASAYAELFERFQNGILNKAGYTKDSSFRYAKDEKYFTAEELLSTSSSFMNFYLKTLFKEEGPTKSEEIVKTFTTLHPTEKMIGRDGYGYACIPFYNHTKEKVEFLPRSIYSSIYGSNGMCAGNTPEEAIVQGIAEIIERYVQTKILKEQPILPDIPLDYIRKFDYIYDMYKILMENKNYTILLKDCSFGGKYPVAALVIIEKNTGRFGVKLGCHPNFAIAMERAFTEATQGQDIFEYTNRSIIDFENKRVKDQTNISNSFKTGHGYFPFQMTIPRLEGFVEMEDVSFQTNKDLLINWVKELEKDGFDILIRDVSYTGFYSYHVIIPGLSELVSVSPARRRLNNTRIYLTQILNHGIETIKKPELDYLISILNYFRNSIMENKVSSLYKMVNPEDIPGEKYGVGSSYMIAMCYASFGDFKKAEEYMIDMMRYIPYKLKREKKSKDIEFFNVTKMYFSIMKQSIKHEKAIKLLGPLCDHSIIEKINEIFKDPSKILSNQYPTSEYWTQETDFLQRIDKATKQLWSYYSSIQENCLVQSNTASLFL